MNKLIIVFAMLSITASLLAEKSSSPYAMFGDNTPTLDVDIEHGPMVFFINVRDSILFRLEVKGDKMTVFDCNDKIVSEEIINPAVHAMFTSIDPKACDTPWISPYAYCYGNPVNYSDPTGCSPIYSSSGVFLGTDDNGLQGGYYVMNEENFVQGMSMADVKKYSIDPNSLDKDVLDLIINDYATLHYRPDFDGYLTHEEANSWYRTGNGQPLYVDLRKIDLSGIRSLGENYVGQVKVFNLLFGASGSINDALVYGNITLKREPNNMVSANPDTYDFDIKPWGNPLICIRNIETMIGQSVAGEGVPYKIHFYNKAPIKPLFPWLR